jgi:type IV pilus assembly protein PilB
MAMKEFDFEKEPIVSIVKTILNDAIKMKATDVHFDPQVNDLLIRFRINGELSEYTTAPENTKLNIITRVKILAGMNITDTSTPQNGAINVEVEDKKQSMRVSTLPIADGEKVVIHISNYAKNIKSIEKIGMEKEDIDLIKNLLAEKQGIILVTGANGSGKATTSYALLKELNNPNNNIISIENPIKMKIKGVNQVQIAPEKGVTYSKVLNNMELQDPNVVAINELIDDEVTRAAVRLSASGRLVISTLNTKTVYQTIENLLNMNVENYLIGDNLLGIISQRLVKKLCPSCRSYRKASDFEKKVIKIITGEDIEEMFYPEGCEECKDGYLGLTPITEVIKVTPELKDAIANNRNRTLIKNIIYSENDTILKDGLKKVLAGITSFSEIIKMIDLRTDFEMYSDNLKKYILGNGETEYVEDNSEQNILNNLLAHENNIEEVMSNLKGETENQDVQAFSDLLKPNKETINNNEKINLGDALKQIENQASESMAKDAGLTTVDSAESSVIPGDPDETEEEVQMSKDLINELKEDDDDDFNYDESYSIF